MKGRTFELGELNGEAINGVIIYKRGNHPTAYYDEVTRRIKEAAAAAPAGEWKLARANIIEALADIKLDIRDGMLRT
jgi:DNA-binding transcriptional regulator PaaX